MTTNPEDLTPNPPATPPPGYGTPGLDPTSPYADAPASGPYPTTSQFTVAGAAAQEPLTPGQERTWAMLSHAIPAAATVLSAGFLGFVASLVIYLAYRDRGPFVRQAAANSLNVQLTTLVVLVASAIIWVPLLFVGVGFLIYGAIFAVAVVLHLIAALRANEGQWYKPPMTIAFVK